MIQRRNYSGPLNFTSRTGDLLFFYLDIGSVCSLDLVFACIRRTWVHFKVHSTYLALSYSYPDVI